MRVTTKAVIDLETGTPIERDSYDYAGPVAECRGGDKQRALTNQYAAQANQRAQELFGVELPVVKEMLSSGYSPAEQEDILQQGFGAERSALESARQRAGARVARTRNAAGYGELEDELARHEGRTLADLGQQAQIRFADEKQRRREAALRDLSGLYGVDTNLLGGLLGTSGRLAQGGGGGLLNSFIGAGGAIGAAAVGG